MLLQMPLFYITKMIMLIFYVTVICLYLCLYVSVSGLPSFKEHISRNTYQWLLPNLAYATRKILLRNFNYVHCLNLAQWKRHSSWAPWNIAPIEKGLWL